MPPQIKGDSSTMAWVSATSRACLVSLLHHLPCSAETLGSSQLRARLSGSLFDLEDSSRLLPMPGMVLALPASRPHSALLSSKRSSSLPQGFTHCCPLCPECSSYSIPEASASAAASWPPSFSSLRSPSYGDISQMFRALCLLSFPLNWKPPLPRSPPQDQDLIRGIHCGVPMPGTQYVLDRCLWKN